MAAPDLSALWITVGDRRVASSRVRAYEMAEALTSAGVDSQVAVGSGIRGRLRVVWRLLGRPYDVVVIQKTMLDRVTLALLKQRSRVVVLECDDAIHLGYPSSTPRATRRLQRALVRTLAAADLVTTTNPLLAGEFQPKRGRVIWFPGPSPRSEPVSMRRAEVALWLGSPSTEVHLGQLGELPRALARKGWECVAVGATPAAEEQGWQVMLWNEEISRRELGRARVGVMPQASSPWDDRKAAYKVLQYAAAGVVPVASDVVPARLLLEGAGLESLLVGPGQNWEEAVLDAAQRAEQYAPRLAALVSHYSHDRAAEAWLKAVRSAIDDKDGAMSCE